ncbi:hypothetical protein FRB91_003568 [Serendipita sp. 411]|nr:hypothetical protein FRC15_002617 [Serendipita sp. 397]KAG8790651.1 hypothetical protein FRC16_000771 [Serendipita sp. 398]KAG8834118.1 hypothetical protein FRC18_002589 [Serendipita sp. 400]KAG8843151.1 hypothetical protein FRB91_003568 [Serendipita sp. 411]KAG8853580.1 hypothetical protein FRC20_001197 [Serendipita sp. 405]
MNRQRRAIAPKNYAEATTDLSDIGDNVEGFKLPGKGRKRGNGKMFHRDLDAVIRSPTSVDIDQAKRNIQYGNEMLDRIQKEVEREVKRSRARVSDLEQQREAVQRDIDLNRSITSKLRTIPDDVFSIIFEYYIEGAVGANPWILMGVCRQWRAAAIQARRIWSKISLTHAIHDTNVPHERRNFGYEICHTVPLLQRALDRAAGAPLHISLNFDHNQNSHIDGDADTPSHQLVKILKDKKAYLNIYKLETENTSTKWMKKAQFDGFEFPALEIAKITTSSRDLNVRIEKTARRLRFLHLENKLGDALDWDLSNMNCLVHLCLSGCVLGVLCGSETIQMVRSASQLTELTLRNLKISSLSDDQSFSAPSLLTLNLWATELECKLDLPNLQTLNIGNSTISKSETNLLVFPSLTSLTVSNFGPEDLLHIRALKPLSLDIVIYSTLALIPRLEEILENVFLPGHLPVRALHLSTDIDPTSLSQFVCSIPHLEEFEFEGLIEPPKEFFDDLAGCSLTTETRATNGKPICTSLKKIRVAIPPDIPPAAEEVIIKWFRKAMEVRKKGMYPINEAFYSEGDCDTWVSVF